MSNVNQAASELAQLFDLSLDDFEAALGKSAQDFISQDLLQDGRYACVMAHLEMESGELSHHAPYTKGAEKYPEGDPWDWIVNSIREYPIAAVWYPGHQGLERVLFYCGPDKDGELCVIKFCGSLQNVQGCTSENVMYQVLVG